MSVALLHPPRIAAARAVIADATSHTDAAIRDACIAVINLSGDAQERRDANRLIDTLFKGK